MSGIYGFAAQKGIPDPLTILNRMQKAIQMPGPALQHQWTAKEGLAGLGAVHPTRIGEPGHFAEDPTHKVYCVFDGVIYRDQGAPGGNLVEPNGAALLLKRYLELGPDCLSEISGSFNVAWWDEKAQRLVLGNDRIGQRLLFFGHRNGVLAFSSLLARVMEAGLLSSEIDVEGLADMITYEHTVGERTLFKDAKVLPPASVLTYERGRVDIRKYWDLGQIEPQGHYDEQRLDEVEELFRIAVRRAIRPDITVAIDLTGGLDSRCILAAAANMDLPFVTHTGGQPDSTDVVLAQQAAAVAGAEHIFERVGPEKVAQWLVPMVRHQGGIISTLHSHPCQHFEMSLPFDASVQGIGINYIRGHWVKAAELDIPAIDAPSTVRSLLKRKMLSHTAKQIDAEELWRPEYRTVGLQAPDAHARELLDQYSTHDRPIAALDNISLHERCRKFLNKAILVVRSAREVYYPYFDHELIIALAKIPMAERVTHTIQLDLLKRLGPQLLDVPTTKTLLPLSASPTKVWLTQKGWGARRRLSRWFRPLRYPLQGLGPLRYPLQGLGPLRYPLQGLGLLSNVPTRVPNHYYSRWIREEMRPTLIELLYNPNAAFRTYLRGEKIEDLLNQHFSGKANWEHLVGTLTVFEITHQLWAC